MSVFREGTIIIDGYNFLRRAFRYLSEEHGLEAARAKLEVRLREFLRTGGQGLRIVLVYDGAWGIAPPAPASPGAESGLEVLFSIPPLNADKLIIEECRRRRERESLTVVTSDLKDIAVRLGPRIRHLTSEEFAEMLDEAMKRPAGEGEEAGGGGSPEPAEKPAPEDISPGEVEEWLRIFSKPKGPPRGAGPGRGPGKGPGGGSAG